MPDVIVDLRNFAEQVACLTFDVDVIVCRGTAPNDLPCCTSLVGFFSVHVLSSMPFPIMLLVWMVKYFFMH